MHRRNGLTFMELLCVIGILAIPAAVLFPVFAQARMENTTDISRLRQLDSALRMYAQDYESSIPVEHTMLMRTGYKPKSAPLEPLLVTGCNSEAPDGSWLSLNGGCEDTVSNLVWSRTSDDATGYYNRVWSREPVPTKIGGAVEYCRDLDEGGFTDWRLPTNAEVVAAQSHHIADYVPMRFSTGWGRWTGTSYTQGKTLYAYEVKLGTTDPPYAVVAKDNKGNYSTATDTICVRTP